MIYARRAMVMFGAVLVFVDSARASNPLPSPPAKTLKPFVRQWRVVLKGNETDDWIFGGDEFMTDGGNLRASLLDAIENALLPALASDLQQARSQAIPADYYRQYASGRWNDQHIVFIKGFHRDFLNLPFTESERERWKHEPVSPSDGGTAFWDAIYVIQTRKFLKMKNVGQLEQTVAFHGEA